MADEIVTTQEQVKEESQTDILKKAVTDAIDHVTKSDDGDLGDESDASDDKKEPEKEEGVALDETEQAQARQLYLALKDPQQAGKIIEYLATEAGYSKIKTAEQAEEAKDAVLEALQESLGPDFEFLTPKLGKAINKILETKLSEHTSDIRANLAAQAESQIRTEATNAYTTIAQKYFGKNEIPGNLMAEMSKLMEIYKPASGMSVSDYMSDMLQTAAARLDVDVRKFKQNNQNQDRINKNRTDAVGRLASERGAVTESTVIGKPPNRKLTLNEAISQAEHDISEASLKK